MHSELCLPSGVLVLVTLQCVDLCDFYAVMLWCRLEELHRESIHNLKHLYQTTLCHVPEGQQIFCLYQLFCFFTHFSAFFLSFFLLIFPWVCHYCALFFFFTILFLCSLPSISTPCFFLSFRFSSFFFSSCLFPLFIILYVFNFLIVSFWLSLISSLLGCHLLTVLPSPLHP